MAYLEKFKKNVHSVFLLLIYIDLSIGAIISDNSRLRADLLRGYDPHSRPVQNHEWTTVITFYFRLKAFDLNERTSILNLYTWTLMVWHDEHLHWDPDNYGNITRVHFPPHELWQPDLTVYNNVDKSEINPFDKNRVVLVVFNTSVVWWVPPTKFQVSCQTNLRKWPYDTQKCTVVVGSWVQDGYQLDMRVPQNITTMDTALFESNREWDLLSATYKRRDSFYSGYHFPEVVLSIEIARKYAAHTACIVVPGLVIAAAVLVAFWLPPGSRERLSILLVSIFINVLYLYYVYSIIPNNGDNVPLVLLFYRDSVMMLAFALVWTIKLRNLAATKRNSPVPLPGVIVTFLNSIPAKILCLDPRPSTGDRTDDIARSNATGQNETGNGSPLGNEVEKNVNPFQEDWAWLAHLLDRVAFLIYLIVYLCFYLALL